MITKEPEKNEILEEKSFKKHKLRTLPIYEKYSNFNLKKACSVLECGEELWFNLKEHKETKERKKTLDTMFTCKDRFCPFCNWRRQMKYSKLIYTHIRELENEKKLRYIFLTLTVKNCKLADLKANIQLMQKSFNKMIRTVKFEKSILGFLRVLEFTVQKNDNTMMHPHFHILLVIEPSYFNPRYKKYITASEWSLMWKKALRVDYKPSVDVKIVRPNKNKNSDDGNASIVAELCKYPMKDTDIEKVEDFEELTKQMKNIRNINSGGVLKGILQKTEKIDENLINIDEDSKDDLWVILEKLLYKFENKNNKLNYYLSKKGE